MNTQPEAGQHPSITLLAKATLIALQEKEALLEEDTARLEALIKTRESLMDASWEQREGCDTGLLMRSMTELATLMETLLVECQNEQNAIRSKLLASKQHRHYTSAPRSRMITSNKRLLFDKPM